MESVLIKSYKEGYPNVHGFKISCDNPKSVILFVHGMAEHIERYKDIANYLSTKGFICYGFDLIGHSKGGNLAVYAAMFVSEQIQQRIGKIYNLDGPGFRTEVYSMGSFEKISDKITKIIPHSSIVGMLLENHGEYQVVDSKNIGFLQHDPYSWLVDRIDFVYLEEIDERHRMMDDGLNKWIMSLSKEEVSVFVNALYQIVSASEATDLISFTKNWTKSLSGMANAVQHLDEATKNSIHSIMKKLAAVSKEHIKEETEHYLKKLVK